MSAETLGNYSFLDKKLKKAIKVSLGLHLALMIFLTLKVYLIPDDLIAYESSLRVDIVALPQKDLQPAVEAQPKPAVKAAPAPNPAAVPEEVVVLKATKKPKADTKKQQEALNRLKQMSALENLKSQMAKDRAPAPANKQIFAGNQIATGSDLKGLSKIQHDSYIAQVERHIKNNWALPQWLANKKLRAQVRVKIDSRGMILSKDLVRPSGNSSFDDVALETIEKSSPVPVPPDKLARVLANEGILFGFPD